MSGGGIGQLVNAIAIDEKHEEVVIAGGTNEIVHSKEETEFVYTIDKSLEKLSKLAEEVKTSFLFPSLALSTAPLKARATYLEESLNKIPNVHVIKPKDVEMDNAHPTENGTKTIMKELHRTFDDLILEEAEENDLTARMYNQVHKMYKVGCRACSDSALYTYLCDNCITESQNVNMDVYRALLEKIKNEMFPAAEPFNSNMETDDQTTDATTDGTTGGAGADATTVATDGMEVDPSKDKRQRPDASDDEAPGSKAVRTEHVVPTNGVA